MGRDRISELPDYLLTHILSYLPTKDSVKTSVLSNRWKFLWLMVPVLDLKLSDSPAYVSIDKFMDFDKKSRMLKFKIKEDKWTSNCRHQILKRFRVIYDNADMCGLDFSIEIDAPQLEYMNFGDNHSDRIVVKNLSSLFMIKIDSELSVGENGTDLDLEDLTKRDTIRDFLKGISSVRHMVISQRTLKVLHQYSKLGPIPKFINLCRLVAAFSTSTLQLLPTFLESCPNLKNLIILDFSGSWKRAQTELTDVPQCLLSSLECVEIKGLAIEKETGKKLVRYFLENSLVLKKLILHLKDSLRPERDILEELRTYAKGSCSCQINIYRICFTEDLLLWKIGIRSNIL